MTVVRCCVAALVAVVVAGCGAGSESLPKPSIHTGGSGPLWTPPVESSTPTPSPEPSATFGPEQLEAAQTVEKFFQILHRLESEPTAPVEDLAYITMGQTRTAFMSTINDYREQGLVVTGTLGVHIEGAEELSVESGEKTVLVHACTDSTASDVVKQDSGESILDSNRAYYVHWKIKVVFANNYAWVVGDMTSQRGKSCVS